VGNLTHDPELSQTNSGISVCKFSLAVQRRYQNAEGSRETDFFNIIVWRAQGENCHKYLRKGNKAGVVGSIQNRSYEDKDGNKRYVTEIVADEVEFLTPRGSMGDSGQDAGFEPDREQRAKPAARKTVAQLEPVEDDDLPF